MLYMYGVLVRKKAESALADGRYRDNWVDVNFLVLPSRRRFLYIQWLMLCSSACLFVAAIVK